MQRKSARLGAFCLESMVNDREITHPSLPFVMFSCDISHNVVKILDKHI